MRGRLRSELRAEPSAPAAIELIAGLIRKIRRDARDIGRQRLQRELQTIVSEAPGGTGYDVARARMVASSYQRALFESAKRVGSLEIAALATDAQAQTIAITETSQAFSQERQRAARELATERGLQLWQVWDAVLDRHTCPRCSRLHGTAVPVGQNFSAGSPGGIHPRCRCVALVTTLDEIRF